MYRKFEVKDQEGKKIILEVDPITNIVTTKEYTIDISMATRQILNELITVASRFMSGNTITELEIKEIV